MSQLPLYSSKADRLTEGKLKQINQLRVNSSVDCWVTVEAFAEFLTDPSAQQKVATVSSCNVKLEGVYRAVPSESEGGQEEEEKEENKED